MAFQFKRLSHNKKRKRVKNLARTIMKNILKREQEAILKRGLRKLVI